MVKKYDKISRYSGVSKDIEMAMSGSHRQKSRIYMYSNGIRTDVKGCKEGHKNQKNV